MAAVDIVVTPVEGKSDLKAFINLPKRLFAGHKGYASPEHLAALKERGPCEIHRKSFEPVHMLLQADLPW